MPWRRVHSSSDTVGWLAFVGMVLAAGTYYSFAKALSIELSPLTLVLLSEFLTATFVLFSAGAFPTIRSFIKLSREQRLGILGIGLTSGIAAPTLLFTGIHSTSAVNAALFGNTSMLFLIVLAVLFLGEKIQLRHIIANAFIIAGILCIALRGFTEGLTLYPGDILVLLSSFFFGLGDIIFRKYLHKVHTTVIVLGRSAIAIIGVLFFSSLVPSAGTLAEVRSLPWEFLGILLGFGFISRFLNVFCFYQALDRLPVGTLSVFSNLTVISSMTFAHLFLKETIHAYQFTGGALIIFGAVLLELLNGRFHSEELHASQLEQSHAHRV